MGGPLEDGMNNRDKGSKDMNIDPQSQRVPYEVSARRYSGSHQMATTAFELPNFRTTQNLGVVRGIVVRSRNALPRSARHFRRW